MDRMQCFPLTQEEARIAGMLQQRELIAAFAGKILDAFRPDEPVETQQGTHPEEQSQSMQSTPSMQSVLPVLPVSVRFKFWNLSLCEESPFLPRFCAAVFERVKAIYPREMEGKKLSITFGRSRAAAHGPQGYNVPDGDIANYEVYFVPA